MVASILEKKRGVGPMGAEGGLAVLRENKKMPTADCRQGRRRRKRSNLLTKSERLDRAEIHLSIRAGEILQEPVAAADHRKEASPRGVIFFVRVEMVLQCNNAISEDRNLDLRRPCVAIVALMGADYFGLAWC